MNDVVYAVTDPTMAGVHGYNFAWQVVDSTDIPDVIGVNSDDGGDNFIPPSLTELYYGGAYLWTYDIDDCEQECSKCTVH